MNRKPFNLLFFLLCVVVFSPAAMAQKKPEYIFPTVKFNEDEAGALLDNGTNSIRGNARIVKKGKAYFPHRNDRILLYPVTPYLTEFLGLRKKYNGKKKQAVMVPEAFVYRVEGKFTDFEGNFEIRDLKPGKYFLMTWITYWKSKTVAVETGTVTTFNMYGQVLGSYPTYEDYQYNYDVESEVSGFVEVTGNGQIVKATVGN